MYMRNRGMGQYDTTSPIAVDTSGVSVNNPTSSQIDAALNSLAQMACEGTGIWDPSTNSCSGSGGSATCPTGYVLNGFACVAVAAAPGAPATVAPTTGSALSSLPSWLIPVAVGSFVLLAFLGAKR
jgi:hypothetical protein